jgi:ketosteroid isomerase-like protein
MKQCPNCRTTYTDDSLQFCLQDGSPLSAVANAEQPTAVWNEPETVVRPRASENWQPSQTTPIAPPKKSNTLFVVLLTAFVTLLLFGGAVGAWLFVRNRNADVAVNRNQNNPANSYNRTNVAASPTASPKTSPTPTATNSNVASPSPTATPAANAEQIKTEVSGAVNSWKSAAESRNLDALMANYADTVDYYNKKGANAGFVRQDRQRAFSEYENIEINITNLRVTPDASGERATVVFDKEWIFENDEKTNEGKVQQQLQLVKIGDRWRIAAERDLKVYYTNKY